VRVRSRIRVEGIVQGVGFRPFVHALADEYEVSGLVGNDAAGVFIEAEGAAVAVTSLVDALRERPPPLAVIDRVSVSPLPPTGRRGFEIVASTTGDGHHAQVAPDTATCADCLAELFDPADRRYRYPFVNCTNCGPRFTIVTAVPYDRVNTTMADFAMCPDCAREYADPRDRRFHAQPVCCPACGPTLRLTTPGGTLVPGDPVRVTASWLHRGAAVAVKGLGGYHLAVDAANESAVASLRSRKRREHKAFAVMVADLAAARDVCRPDRPAADLLAGPTRPIVLLPRRPDGPIAPSVAPGTDELGVMLPYTPLHHLLAREIGRPFVLTSGNVSDEPIAYRDDDARTRLSGLADAFLAHDRPVRSHADDSVVRVFRGRPLLLRRSRGYAPRPLSLPWPFPRPVLGCGAELKNTFCLATGQQAVLSQHIGDLETRDAYDAFTRGVRHLRRLFHIDPAVVAHDLHPDYLSTTYARGLEGVELVAVQHHHAHIASCLADNGEPGPVIGLAFDGTGYGADGTIWGGEVLVADLTGFTRAGHLEPVPLPGGPAAIRQPWRMAAAYLHHAYGSEAPDGLAVTRRHRDQWSAVQSLAARGVNSPLTSSAGRLFDAVAALIGVRDEVTYEAQAAVELQRLADPNRCESYPVRVVGADPVRIAGADLVRGAVDDLRRDVDPAVIAARFHRGLADAAVVAVCRIAELTGLRTVALSGGVFSNELLLGAVADGLRRHRLRVLLHQRVPCNDGGISLGQVAVAGARDRAARGL
jgi:hydrogenase maturation protein HypF